MDMLSPLLHFSPTTTPPFSRDAAPGPIKAKQSVYVAAVPLRAAPGPPQLLLSTAYHLGLGHPHLQHYIVLIKSEFKSKSSPQAQVFVFDFQPKDPENILAPLAVISQRKLPGVILKREIQRIPRTRCWFVGFSKGNSLEIANTFNRNWSTDLLVGTNDCRHYTNGLVECLTGRDNVLESLKQTFN